MSGRSLRAGEEAEGRTTVEAHKQQGLLRPNERASGQTKSFLATKRAPESDDVEAHRHKGFKASEGARPPTIQDDVEGPIGNKGF